jgi:hypothetical protein
MKLKKALNQINKEDLFKVLIDLELELNDVEYSLEECRDVYGPVIEDLLSKKEVASPNRIVIVKEQTGPAYYDVHILNEAAYPNEKVSLGGMFWEHIASAPIVCDSADLDLLHQVAYILWELTYDGWSEQEQMEFYSNLSKAYAQYHQYQ